MNMNTEKNKRLNWNFSNKIYKEMLFLSSNFIHTFQWCHRAFTTCWSLYNQSISYIILLFSLTFFQFFSLWSLLHNRFQCSFNFTVRIHSMAMPYFFFQLLFVCISFTQCHSNTYCVPILKHFAERKRLQRWYWTRLNNFFIKKIFSRFKFNLPIRVYCKQRVHIAWLSSCITCIIIS